MKLTFYADDFGFLPLSISATLCSRHVALQETIGALVTRHGVDVVMGAPPANQEGVVHRGRGPAEHCKRRWTQKKTLTLSLYAL